MLTCTSILLSFCPFHDPIVAEAIAIPETEHSLPNVASGVRVVVSRQSQSPAALRRSPVETPPTEYLPYPPPSNYPWPAGESPATETPQPSEQNPPAGWYTGQSGNSGSNTGGSVASSAGPARSMLVPNLITQTLLWILPYRIAPQMSWLNPRVREHGHSTSLSKKDPFAEASAVLQSHGPSEHNKRGRGWMPSRSHKSPGESYMTILVVMISVVIFALILGA